MDKRRDGLERITRIHLDPLTRSQPSITTRSYEGQQTLRRIALDFVSDFEDDILPGSLRAIPFVLVEGYAWDGSTANGLTDLLTPFGVAWYCDNDRIRFNRTGVTEPGETLVINRNTGLVSSPNDTDDGVELTTLLEPRARIGGLIRLTSDASR